MESEAKDLQKLLFQMRNDWPPTREAAMREAAQLPKERLRALLAVAERVSRSKHRQANSLIVTALLLNGFAILALMTQQLSIAAIEGSLLGFIILDLIAIASIRWIPAQSRFALTAALDVCMATQDGQFLGTVLRRFQMLSRSRFYEPELDPAARDQLRGSYNLTRNQMGQLNEVLYGEVQGATWEKIRNALQQMLPAISEADYHALKPEEHAILLRLVRHPLDDKIALLSSQAEFARRNSLVKTMNQLCAST